MLPWILCGVLVCVVIALIIKIVLMQRSVGEICSAIQEHLDSDANGWIRISSGDRYIRRLANRLNSQLSSLSRQRQKYMRGDRELKEAIANISHDLRTPLTAICGYLALLEREQKSQEAEKYLSNIQNRAEALTALTEELLRYSMVASAPELSFEKVNICQTLEECLISFRGVMEQKQIVPDIKMPEKAVYRELDKLALFRIFGNLISNVVKYSDGDLCVNLTEDGCVSFSNSAKDLSNVDVGKLFDRFYTVDTARRSTGLGLSIAKILTEKMNGSIAADYQDGILTITVRFP